MKNYDFFEDDDAYAEEFSQLVRELRRCNEIEKMDFKFTYYEDGKEMQLNTEHFKNSLAIGCKKVFKRITKDEVQFIYVFGVLNFN